MAEVYPSDNAVLNIQSDSETGLQRYIVEFAKLDKEATDVQDLTDYLNNNPHQDYHLVSSQYISRNRFMIIWEINQ